MGISFSSLVCGEPEPEEVTVEHGDSVPNSKAIYAAIASGLAAATDVRNDELQADLGWRISGPLGHSTVAEPQDLEGPCVDLRANELWVVVPTDTFLARLPNLSPKVQEGAPIVLWRGLATHDGWHVRYGGGELSTEWVTSGQAALLWHALTPTMHATTLQRSRVRVPGPAAARGRPPHRMPTHLLRVILWAPTPLRRLPTPVRFAFGRARPEEEVGTHAAATLQRYYAFCAAAESTPGLVVG